MGMGEYAGAYLKQQKLVWQPWGPVLLLSLHQNDSCFVASDPCDHDANENSQRLPVYAEEWAPYIIAGMVSLQPFSGRIRNRNGR